MLIALGVTPLAAEHRREAVFVVVDEYPVPDGAGLCSELGEFFNRLVFRGAIASEYREYPASVVPTKRG